MGLGSLSPWFIHSLPSSNCDHHCVLSLRGETQPKVTGAWSRGYFWNPYLRGADKWKTVASELEDGGSEDSCLTCHLCIFRQGS